MLSRHRVTGQEVTMKEGMIDGSLRRVDPEIAGSIEQNSTSAKSFGIDRFRKLCQRSSVGSQGSVLTNKYAEGYPGRRYYGVVSL